ncbi:MAG: hypothetical protein QF391_13535 [Myxococcota bacterium]|nr:hypothetical protein [Myxococcota bacterium]
MEYLQYTERPTLRAPLMLMACAGWPDAAEGDFLVGGMMPVAVIFAISTAALIIVSLFTAPPDERHLARFFRSGEAG